MPSAKSMADAVGVLVHHIKQAGGGRLSADAAAELEDAQLAFGRADEAIAAIELVRATVGTPAAQPEIFHRHPAPWHWDETGDCIFDDRTQHIVTLTDTEDGVGEFIVECVNQRMGRGPR